MPNHSTTYVEVNGKTYKVFSRYDDYGGVTHFYDEAGACLGSFTPGCPEEMSKAEIAASVADYLAFLKSG
ncbi:hypothetical protein [Erythrobacter aurantius]|uniref:hypothetical protein n=1 Tax=Erythrobacter aurantius TaxID=2909249 RepID=UPI00207944C5|nr:hypothetical protein [Erythrobacter aurantius]